MQLEPKLLRNIPLDTMKHCGSLLPEDAVESRNPKDGSLFSLKARNLSVSLEPCPDFAALRARGDEAEAALLFIERHAAAFRLAEPRAELSIVRVERDELGFQHVRLAQRFQGLPVLNAELIAHFDRDFRLYLINGRYIPTPAGLKTEAAISVADASSEAARAVAGKPMDCGDCKADLAIYPEQSGARLVYVVKVNRKQINAWSVIIDATSGKFLEKISDIRSR